MNLHNDHNNLGLDFVHVDLVCSSLCPILLKQVKIGQRAHGKYELTGRTPETKSTKSSA